MGFSFAVTSLGNWNRLRILGTQQNGVDKRVEMDSYLSYGVARDALEKFKASTPALAASSICAVIAAIGGFVLTLRRREVFSRRNDLRLPSCHGNPAVLPRGVFTTVFKKLRKITDALIDAPAAQPV